MFSLDEVPNTLLVVCTLLAEGTIVLVAVKCVLVVDLWLKGVAATNGVGLVFVADVTEVFFERTDGVAVGTGFATVLLVQTLDVGLDTAVFF